MSNSLLLRLTIAVSLIIVLLICCGPSFRSDTIFGYRDAGLFYFPLFQVVRDEWYAGRVPLWNPYVNAGQPLAAAATASAFYPGQLLFLLPLPFSLLFNFYILLHLLLAAWGSWTLARGQGRTVAAAGLATLAYTFSGAVLFQTCNIVFLCSAALMPFGLHFGLGVLNGSNRFRSPLSLSAILALLVLCGDPQSAYHLGLLLGLFCIFRLGNDWPASGKRMECIKRHSRQWLTLSAAAAGAACLSLIQISPTAEFARLSERNSDTSPLSVWNVPKFIRQQSEPAPRHDTDQLPRWYDAMVGNPAPPAKQYLNIYGFSAEPFRCIDFIWPRFYGSGLPEIDRWTDRAGITHAQYWTVSIYCGWIPFLLACAGARWLRGDWKSRAFAWIALLSFLASWGQYGVSGLIRMLSESASGNMTQLYPRMGDEVGGVYWWLVTFLPGYESFRYPAKWLTITVLAVTQMSAIGFDGLGDPETRRRALRYAGSFAAFLALGFLVTIGLGILHGWYNAEQQEESQLVYLLWRTVVLSAMQSFLVFAFSILWLKRQTDLSQKVSTRFTIFLILFTAGDLAISQRALVFFMPASVPAAGEELIDAIRQDRAQTPFAKNSPQPRVYRCREWSPDTSNFPLFAQHAAETLGQNAPLLHHIGIMAKADTMELNDFNIFFDVLPVPGRDELICPRRSYDLWSTEYFVLPATSQNSMPGSTYLGLDRAWESETTAEFAMPLPSGQPLPEFRLSALSGTPLSEPIRVMRNVNALPRARIVHQALVIDPIAPMDRERWLRVMELLAFPFPGALPIQTTALIEDTELLKQKGSQLGSATTPAAGEELCSIVCDEPQLVEIEARLQQPGLIVLADTYYPGWTLLVSTDGKAEIPMEILRVNRLQRGCWLPAGNHRLIYRYRPQSFRSGATISAMAVGVWCLLWCTPSFKRREDN